MAEHKDIQKPEDYNDKDYQEFHDKLFSSSTPRTELEGITIISCFKKIVGPAHAGAKSSWQFFSLPTANCQF